MPIELLTVGRVSVDLYAEQLRVPLAEVTTFRKSVGGTATNVAVACARLGHHAAVFTRVGNDAFGRYVTSALSTTFGVDTRFVSVSNDLLTPLAFADLENPEDPTIIFYRRPAAPDMSIEPNPEIIACATEVPIFWFPTACLAEEPSRSTIHTLLDARHGHVPANGHTIIDLDWRPHFWASEHECHIEIEKVLDQVTMAIGNRKECEVAVGISDPERAAEALLARGLQTAIVKMGADGVLVATADGIREQVKPYRVEAVCGLGAGDAFGGALCHGLLSGWSLAESARAGNAAGAIVAGRLMCADDMPTWADIEHLLRSSGVPDAAY